MEWVRRPFSTLSRLDANERSEVPPCGRSPTTSWSHPQQLHHSVKYCLFILRSPFPPSYCCVCPGWYRAFFFPAATFGETGCHSSPRVRHHRQNVRQVQRQSLLLPLANVIERYVPRKSRHQSTLSKLAAAVNFFVLFEAQVSVLACTALLNSILRNLSGVLAEGGRTPNT